MEDHEIVSEEYLRHAREVLDEGGTDHLQRLAKAVCVLLAGVVDRLLEEYEPTEEQR